MTKSDFFRARAEHVGFFRTLESLFLTHTLLFIGYSVSDPDIQLLLENATITALSDHPDYALMAQGLHPAIRAAFLRTYNIEILEFDPANNYEEFLLGLQDLATRVEESAVFNRKHLYIDLEPIVHSAVAPFSRIGNDKRA